MKKEDIEKIKNITEDLLERMTINDFKLDLKSVSDTEENKELSEGVKESHDLTPKETVFLNIELKEPQIFIGSNGQTLFDLQRLLRIILNKRLGINFYLELDINNYKTQKIEYLKNLAKNIANEAFLNRETKILPPMPAYQRRIIHLELEKRQDIKVESEGDNEDRHIVIKPI